MPRHDGAPRNESKKESNLAMTGLRLRARPAEYGMNVDRIVAPPTPNDQAPGSAFTQMSPLQDAVRTLGVVNALTFPICNRFDLNGALVRRDR
jgi:hypothetical protein